MAKIITDILQSLSYALGSYVSCTRCKMTNNLEKILFILSFVFILVVGSLLYDFITSQDRHSNQPQEAMTENSEITINVVTENLFPLSYLDQETGTIGGIATQIIEQVLDDTGYQYSIQLLPWSEAYTQALSKENTVIFSMARIPARENKFIWLNKITELNYGLYTPNMSLTELSFDEIKDLYITVTRNDLSHHLLKDMGFNKFVFIRQNDRYNDLIARDQIDFMLASDLWIIQNQNSLPTPLYLQREVNFDAAKQDMYFAINANTDPAIVYRIRRSFKKLTNDNTFDDLHAPYMNKLQTK